MTSPNYVRANTSHVMMVRPAQFQRNPQTAESNAFQATTMEAQEEVVRAWAIAEFDAFVALLRDNGVTVNVIQDTDEPLKPDAVFPNNWITTHENGYVILYPMEAENRRYERRSGILELLERGYTITDQIDLSHWEEEGIYLEGTGSLILDRTHKVAYACMSSRTHTDALNDFSEKTGYDVVSFSGVDAEGLPIYHTNVMMCMAEDFVLICMESVPDHAERKRLYDSFTKTGKEVLEITLDQMSAFAGNMLELINHQQERLLVMSKQAYDSLDNQQVMFIEARCRIVAPEIYTIEKYGGGSARCMIAEI
ncbi:MAG: arginine deiminase-related protein, partial [Bacteroidota bacterium]